MLTIPFLTVLEEAQSVPGEKHLAGNVKNPKELFTPEALGRLANWHRGVFAFLAFNPVADSAVVQYLGEGTLADDSGSRIMCLFSYAAAEATRAVPAALAAMVEIDTRRTPAAMILEELFGPASPPAGPGIVFFGDVEDDAPVYVPLSDCADADAVRAKLRDLFARASTKADASAGLTALRERFSSDLAVTLQRGRIEHRVAGRRSIRQWLLMVSQTSWDHREELVTAAGLAGL